MGDRWTELKLLTEKDIDSCIDVKNEMIERFKNKPYAFDFLKKREDSSLNEAIENNELYGIFDKKTNELLAFNIIKQISLDYIFDEEFEDRDNKYLINNRILNILKSLRSCYIESLVTRLRPNIFGIGKHFINISDNYIKNKLNCDFRIEIINADNIAMYRLYTNNNDSSKFSFGCLVKKIEFTNMIGITIKPNMFCLITIFNQNAINSLKSIIEVDNRYEKDTISNLANKINNKENIFLIEGTKAEVYKIKE